MTSSDAPVFEAVRLGFPTAQFYARAVYADGRVAYAGNGWLTLWSAEWMAARLRQRFYLMALRRGDIGNGDCCPIYPEHGPMFALPVRPGHPQQQYCPHVDHDGRSKSQHTPEALPRSRAIWPMHGFGDTVRAHFARYGGLPDLSAMEVDL